ncbi:hypothetical protein [Sulfurimonas sp.]|uniref:hypothetical protein n=1 Tax=Sulfurimonas sp. TaxID=2022749 RepID=UPI003D0F27C1
MGKNFIFLDFDGVLFDTVKEAYAVAVISQEKYKSIKEINFDSEHYKKFRKLRFLVSPAWNYKYLLESIKTIGDIAMIEEDFRNKIKLASKIDYQNFENNFFRTRDFLKKTDYDSWFGLNTPFNFLYNIKNILNEFEELVYIITTKDSSTVSKLLSLEGIKLKENRILGKEEYEKFGNKKNIILNLNPKCTKSIFIDDSDKHVTECSEIENLKCFVPDWGYIGPNSKPITKEQILDEIKNLIGG